MYRTSLLGHGVHAEDEMRLPQFVVLRLGARQDSRCLSHITKETI
jgi:hypothetical protein